MKVVQILLLVAAVWIVGLLGSIRNEARDERRQEYIRYMQSRWDESHLPPALCLEFRRWQDLANDHEPVKGLTERCE